jgi:hypothetical protein
MAATAYGAHELACDTATAIEAGALDAAAIMRELSEQGLSTQRVIRS